MNALLHQHVRRKHHTLSWSSLVNERIAVSRFTPNARVQASMPLVRVLHVVDAFLLGWTWSCVTVSKLTSPGTQCSPRRTARSSIGICDPRRLQGHPGCSAGEGVPSLGACAAPGCLVAQTGTEDSSTAAVPACLATEHAQGSSSWPVPRRRAEKRPHTSHRPSGEESVHARGQAITSTNRKAAKDPRRPCRCIRQSANGGGSEAHTIRLGCAWSRSSAARAGSRRWRPEPNGVEQYSLESAVKRLDGS